MTEEETRQVESSQRQHLVKCDGNSHFLEIVYRNKRISDNAENVVRWCKYCGAVVVDIDIDNRTINAGGVLEMRFPTVSTT